MQDYNKLTGYQLASLLKDRNLPVTGIKIDQIRRLEEYDDVTPLHKLKVKRESSPPVAPPRCRDEVDDAAEIESTKAYLRDHYEEPKPDEDGQRRLVKLNVAHKANIKQINADSKSKIDLLELQIKKAKERIEVINHTKIADVIEASAKYETEKAEVMKDIQVEQQRKTERTRKLDRLNLLTGARYSHEHFAPNAPALEMATSETPNCTGSGSIMRLQTPAPISLNSQPIQGQAASDFSRQSLSPASSNVAPLFRKPTPSSPERRANTSVVGPKSPTLTFHKALFPPETSTADFARQSSNPANVTVVSFVPRPSPHTPERRASTSSARPKTPTPTFDNAIFIPETPKAAANNRSTPFTPERRVSSAAIKTEATAPTPTQDSHSSSTIQPNSRIDLTQTTPTSGTKTRQLASSILTPKRSVSTPQSVRFPPFTQHNLVAASKIRSSTQASQNTNVIPTAYRDPRRNASAETTPKPTTATASVTRTPRTDTQTRLNVKKIPSGHTRENPGVMNHLLNSSREQANKRKRADSR